MWVLWKSKSHYSWLLNPCSSPAGLIYAPRDAAATSFGPWKLSKMMGKVRILQVYRKKEKVIIRLNETSNLANTLEHHLVMLR